MKTDNNLLAIFLGWVEQTDPTERWFGGFRDLNGTVHRNTDKEPLLFHSDWDWLMQVVKKINVIDDYRFTVKILSMDVEIYDNVNNKNVIDYFSPYSCDELERAVYEACVQFVKWYNEQK